MTSQEFVLWLKGFTEGVHEYNITPKQWDLLKEKLSEIKDTPNMASMPYPIGVPNMAPSPYPTPYDPFNPFKVYCDNGYPGVLKADNIKYTTTTTQDKNEGTTNDMP